MPATNVRSEVIKSAVRLACRAPSLHNSQPWQWVIDGDRVDLFLDPGRAMLSDRSAREALISCGAALDHFCVAMAAAGWRVDLGRFPNPNNSNHLASMAFTPIDWVTEADRRRADAILLRRTDRLPFIAPMNWESFEPVLRSAVNDDSVHLDVLGDDMRPRLTDASQIAESLRLYDSSYHAELGWWTAPFEASEGIPYSALISAAESDRVGVGRLFPITRHGDRRPDVPEDDSTILLLSTDSDDRADALACGEALSAILLECAMVGFATCPVTHLTEVSVARDMLATLIDNDLVPQVLVRVGIAPAMDDVPPPTPRRPLNEVLRVQI